MISIAIVGPESTGKSTLASDLASHYNTVCVPEYSREFLSSLNRPYVKEDLLAIAKGQLAEEQKYRGKADRLIFLDTDLFVVKVWSEFKYGDCDPSILQLLSTNQAGFYLLTSPDIPYEEDPLRESPKDRERLFDIYHKVLVDAGVDFHVVEGSDHTRFQNAIQAINKMV